MTNKSAVVLINIPLDKIIESPWNPRQHFDPAKQATLVESLRTHGQLTSALVRPTATGAKYELAAGHRRFRAAKLAGLATLECKVRVMNDEEFSEILGIENDEREDVHPLEQAQGYRLLMERSGYDVAKIAARVQRSHDFVYDRLALLELAPELKDLFLDNRFTLGHAIVLSKLSLDEQRRAAKRPEREHGINGLWRNVGATLDDKVFPLTPNTVEELKAWIAREVRFDETKVLTAELFPQTEELIEAAAETGVRVVSITYDEYLRPNAKDDTERTFTRRFWKRADGLEKSKECEYAVVGILRVGEGRGQSMGVCLRRDKCKTHWPAEVKAAEQREKAKKGGKVQVTTTGKPAKESQYAIDERKRAERNAIAQREREKVAAATPAIFEAFNAALKKAPIKTLEKLIGASWLPKGLKVLPVGTSADDLLRHLTSGHLARKADNTYTFMQDVGKYGKLLKVDVKKIIAATPDPNPAAPNSTEAQDADEEDGE